MIFLLALPARAQGPAPRELTLLPLVDAVKEGQFAEGLFIDSATVRDFQNLFVSARYQLLEDSRGQALVLRIPNADERALFGYDELRFIFADSRGRRSLSRRAVLRQVFVPVRMAPEDMIRRFGREFSILRAPPRSPGEPPWRVYAYPEFRLHLFYGGFPGSRLDWYIEGLREIPGQTLQPLRFIRQIIVGDLPELRAQIETSSSPARAYSTLSWPDSFLLFDELPGFPERDANYYLLLSRAWDRKGDHARALEALQRGMEAFPRDPWLPFAAGEALRLGGRGKPALEKYRRAVALGLPNGWAAYRLAQLLAQTGRQEEAVQVLNRALNRPPPVESILRAAMLKERGLAFYKLKRLDGFVADLQQARRLDPGLQPPHFLMGEALARLGRLKEAAGEFRRVLKQKPQTPEAYWNLGVILERLHHNHEALRAWENFLALASPPDQIAEARRREIRLRSELPAPRPGLAPGAWERLLGPTSETWAVVAMSSSRLCLREEVEPSPWETLASSASLRISTGPLILEIQLPPDSIDPREARLRQGGESRRNPLQAIGKFLKAEGAFPKGELGGKASQEDLAGPPSQTSVHKAIQELADKSGVPVSSAAAVLRLALSLPPAWFLLKTAPAAGPARLSWEGAPEGLEQVATPFGPVWSVRVRLTLQRVEQLNKRKFRIVRLVLHRWASPQAPGLGIVKELRSREEASEVLKQGERLRGPFSPVAQEKFDLQDW